MSGDPHGDPDMFRGHVHAWRWLDRMEVWQCTTCRHIESDDDRLSPTDPTTQPTESKGNHAT